MKIPYFHSSNLPLRMANDEEKSQFYKMRGTENKMIDFVYPDIINFTISPSDFLPVYINDIDENDE